jgi:hypothetical protein
LPHDSADARNPAIHTAQGMPSDRTDSRTRETTARPVSIRTAPSADGVTSPQPLVTLRFDQWSIADVDGVVRLAAYARGPLAYEDLNLVRNSAAMPQRMGTGVGFVTDAPVYVGATIASDAPIYDFDLHRFRGARWSTSVFLGAATSLGPIYLGTTQESNGTRSAYLYLGKWF